MDLTIKNKVILAPIPDILEEVKRQSGNRYLNYIGKVKGDTVKITCPWHKNGQENHPSCHVYARRDNPDVYYGTVHCLGAGTKIPTKNGIKNIENLIHEPTEIINGNGDWEKTQFKCYGKSEIVKLTLKRENIYNFLYCTPEHEWFIGKERKIKTTDNLKIGDYLSSQYHFADDFILINEAVRHGIIYADGTRNKCYPRKRIKGTNKRYTDNSVEPKKCSYKLNLSELTQKPLLEKFFHDDMWTIKYHVMKEGKYYTSITSKRFDISHNFKKLPNNDVDRNYMMSFLAGYFACDGSIKGKSFASINYDDMLMLRDMFVKCGASIRNMTTHVRKPGNTYLTDRCSTIYTTKVILETLPSKFFLCIKPNIEKKKYIRGQWKIVNIECTKKVEKVYCCETSTKSFVIDENILTHNCFTCSKAVPLYSLVGHCLNEDDEYGKLWLADNFGDIISNSVIDDLEPINIDNKNKLQFIDESELEQYNQYHPYMKERNLTFDVLKNYKIGYDSHTEMITFPVWDIHNNLVMITKRSVNTKKFEIPEGVEKPVYLLNFMKNENTVYVCESQINTLTLLSWGYPAIGLIGTGSSKQYEILNKTGIRNYILCFDGDDAGNKGAEKFKKNIRKDVIVTQKMLPFGNDVNDLTKEQFDNLLVI